MIENEKKMKLKGESRVWGSIIKSDGKAKDVSSTQLGQQLLMDEALRIQEGFTKWVGKSYEVDRATLKDTFHNDEETLMLLLKTLLFLTGSASGALTYKSTNIKKTRHKKIKSINEKIYKDLTFELTWKIVEIIIDLSHYFQVDKAPIVKNSQIQWSVGYTCTLNEAMFDKLSTKALMSFYPMPMTEKPLDWVYNKETKEIVGGYDSFQYDMVRVQKKYLKYGQYGQDVYDAVNYAQSTPWRVNEEVLEHVRRDLTIPNKIDFVKATYPESDGCMFGTKISEEGHGLSDIELSNTKTSRKIFQQGVDLYNAEVKDFESAVGKYRAVKMAIEIADNYKGETIYFPHSLDSRGRIYPIPVGLTPQGSDAVKSMIEYENGEVLNQEGAAWAFAYLASLYGDDKLHFDDRVQRGIELINADYKDADEPYQFLAHQLECHKIAEDTQAIFKGRIHLDACNSGSQFTSALTGDRAGCLATNVIPTIKEDGKCDRQDAYLLVSNRSIELTKNILLGDITQDEREVHELLLDLLEREGRKICKRPVMVSNYGGTAGGMATMLYDMFRELGVERKYITQPNAIAFAKIIGSSITGVLNGGKAFERYIQKMNNMISKKGVPVTWKTSDGFLVTHVKNKELPPKKVALMLPNAKRKTTIMKKLYSDEVAPQKMRSAISPNYIHSLDAELLRRVALRMRDEGIKDSDWIHDSFGCLPNQVSQMLEITKEVFLKMMESKPLESLDRDLKGQALRNGNTEKQLAKVEMPNLGGVNMDNGDLKGIINSEWFFS